MSFKIATATREDLQEILNLQKECYQTEAELHNEYNIPPLLQTSASIHDEFEQGTLFLKGVADGQLMASVRGYIKNSTAYICRLIVKNTHQNKGYGQALMKEIENELYNCKRYELFTGFKSVKNLQLYKKSGYTEFSRQVINDNLTLVYLEKLNDK